MKKDSEKKTKANRANVIDLDSIRKKRAALVEEIEAVEDWHPYFAEVPAEEPLKENPLQTKTHKVEVGSTLKSKSLSHSLGGVVHKLFSHHRR